MSTTVRITDEDRKRLDRIQRRLTDLTGERKSLQEILGLMTRHAEEAPDHILHAAWDPGATRAALQESRRFADAHGGWEGSVDEIDDVLHGET